MILAVAGTTAGAASFLGIDFSRPSDQLLRDLREAQADEWSWVGENMVFRGNIRIPYNDMVFYADNVIIGVENRDIELSGNVRIYRMRKRTESMSIDALNNVLGLADNHVRIVGYTTDAVGRQMVSVEISTPAEEIRTEYAAGNLATGWFSFAELYCNYGTFVANAESGERRPGGEIDLKGVEISTCTYLADNESHYSIYCGSATIKPHEPGFNGLRGYNTDLGEHSIIGYNCQIRVFGLPVLWLPMFYKPKDESLGLFQIVGGESSDYGYYISLSRKFNLSDYPYSWIRTRLDWFSLRGVGYGATGGFQTETSKTSLFAYGIHDIRPYESSEVEDYRLEIPHARYGFAAEHLTHITPRLDVKGQFSVFSDYYFLRDYRDDLFNSDPEPASFIAMEYQFDRASLAFIVRPQINSFYTTAQQLPSAIIDIPRQELFGTGIYYQGRIAAEYLSMRWREFDEPQTYRDQAIRGPDNYSTFRFDSVNFLYYPFKLFEVLNIVPRAGIRFTEYTNSSDAEIDEEDIGRLMAADRPTSGKTNKPLNNYDNEGGNRFRVAGELGFETSMKFYRSWQNVRSPFFNLDGLRHVIEPYTNYTYIPRPSEDRANLYYFDDIDRIQENNFVRFGVKNRLQTRRGGAANPQLHNWFSMENYWDLFFKKDGDYNSIGDLGTVLEFTPGNGFSMRASCSFDVGDNYERQDVMRNGRNVGRPGLDWARLNYLDFEVRYALLEDLILSLKYDYSDSYLTRSTYSMGSTLINPDGASSWSRYSDDMTQKLTFGVEFPITRDRDFRGAYSISYDFNQGAITEQSLRLVKTLHCWDVIFEVVQDRNFVSRSQTYRHEYSFRVTAVLNGMISPLQQVQRQMAGGAARANDRTGNFSFM